eukprot:4103857-Prymnesium_polylepis.1
MPDAGGRNALGRASPVGRRRPVHAPPAALPADGTAGGATRGRAGAVARRAAHGLVQRDAAVPAAGERGPRVRAQPARRRHDRLAHGRPRGGRHRRQHRRHAQPLVGRPAALQPAPRAHADGGR